MFRSKIALGVALLVAGVVPYVALDSDLRNKVKSSISQIGGSETKAEPTLDINGVVADKSVPEHNINHHVNTRETPLVFTPTVHNLRDIFRFDITPNWVKSRWPRVSSVGSRDGMDGFRVPVVTGTTVSDIHGSLTYYFNKQHTVQRILFHGYCGDASRLIELVMSDFGFTAKHTHSAGLYLRTYMGKPVGALRIINAAVVRADQPNDHLQVTLEVNNIHGPFKMSESFARTLESDRMNGRY